MEEISSIILKIGIMIFGNRKTLHKREDGSSFLLDDGNFELQKDSTIELVEIYNEVAEILSRYEDTRERAKNPDYLRGVLQSYGRFIEEDRTREIYDWLKTSPLGEQAKAQFVAETLNGIPGALYQEIDVAKRKTDRLFTDLDKRLTVEDLVITHKKGADRCSVSLREGHFDDLKNSLIVEVSKESLEDVETYRQALGLLYSLAEKGYRVTNYLASFFSQDLIRNPEERKAALADEELLNKIR